ncbi:MAG TPA: methylmalonyl-CoA mutase family protein [Kofleriaceae bacterium]
MAPVKKPETPQEYKTMSGIPLKAVYTPEDLTSRGWTYDDKLGNAGQYPFTRGPHATMYRGKPWTMRMFAGFGTPEDTNQRFKFLLANGQTGLSTAFDMPTLMGYDPDHTRSLGEVGREGVSVATLDDMMRLFGDIPLDKVSTSMTINAPAAVLLALYVAVAEKQGVSPDKLRGTLQNDMLKEFIAQKEWISPIRGHMRIIRDMLVWCTRTMPQWNTISISGYHIREAGATGVQELAFTIADGIGYVQLGIEGGLDVDEFGPRLSYFWDVHNDFFEEIAKFRAGRRMWAKIMRERFGAKNPKSWLLRTHAQTAGVSLMAQQPLNNIVRTTVQALAAVLGGTQSLHTNSYDETYALPTEAAAEVALRTQQVIYEETGVANVADPLAGSYFVETLTDQVEAAAWEYINKIAAMGGIVKAVEEGYPQREIARAAFEFQREVDSGRRSIVGVNKYTTPGEGDHIPTLKIELETEHNQIQKVKQFRGSRDEAQAERALAAVRAALKDDKQNVMPPIFDAVKQHVTLGEICDLFRSELGEYRDPAYL